MVARIGMYNLITLIVIHRKRKKNIIEAESFREDEPLLYLDKKYTKIITVTKIGTNKLYLSTRSLEGVNCWIQINLFII